MYTINNEKEVMTLQKGKEGYIKGFRGEKGKGEIMSLKSPKQKN